MLCVSDAVRGLALPSGNLFVMARAMLFLFALLASAQVDPFSYNSKAAVDLQTISTRVENGVEIRDVTFASLAGGRTPAYLVQKAGGGTRAGILYVHWFEPPDPTSNRTEYLQEAISMAKQGAVSLLPATMWSDFKWFETRKREQDLPNSLQQLRELRHAIDVLLAQPGVDPKRVAYVGHDFGAMFGALMASVDRRAGAYALQAGTTSFSNWYLFGPPMKEPARSQFIQDLSVLDPVAHIGKANGPVLLQFATRDQFVSRKQADALFAAAQSPKDILFYDAEHKMNQKSVEDRMEWLGKQLGLTPLH